MRFDFLKFKKKKIPTSASLHPHIFDTDFFWFWSLGVAFVILIIVGFVGFKFLYFQYFEKYKEIGSTENLINDINVDQIKNAVQKRIDFANNKTSLPQDPSF
jgi:multisubunit Na+/H+ antiporter MnhB subunit